jgi:hypothetical protein
MEEGISLEMSRLTDLSVRKKHARPRLRVFQGERNKYVQCH